MVWMPEFHDNSLNVEGVDGVCRNNFLVYLEASEKKFHAFMLISPHCPWKNLQDDQSQPAEQEHRLSHTRGAVTSQHRTGLLHHFEMV